jgi:hypothetical protein
VPITDPVSLKMPFRVGLPRVDVALTEPETGPAEAGGRQFGIVAEDQEAIVSVGQDKLGELLGMVVIGLAQARWPR